jgi:hypothetical protein
MSIQINNFNLRETVSSNNNNMYIYSLVNYDSGGLLIDIFEIEGLEGLIKVFNSKEFQNNMYQNGIGKEFDDQFAPESSHVICNISSEVSDSKPIHVSKT